ncbi:MAG: OmpA family protein [Sandaracinaceae bacterium]
MRISFLCSIVLLAAACGSAPPPATGDEPLLVELRNNRIVFNHRIEFEHDSATLVPEDDPILDGVAAVLAEHEEIYQIQVQGHTSAVGNAEHNQELSEARAAAIADALRERGVTQEITSQGYGPTYPVCQEDTDECHAQNRRVEFFVDTR